MSSSTGPYKSRLLNWINRQSLHWSDRLEKTARHLKVTAEWGTQLLLYPMYLLFQTGRMTGQQLGQTVRRSHRAMQPSSPTSDQPIQKVLEAIEPSQALPNQIPSTVQGVASVLKTQTLVVVTESNQISGLTELQQRHLRQRISWEVSDYWHQRRQLQPVRTGQLPAQPTSPHVLAPARFFWRVMHWLQRSPVAIALNLFGESTFVRTPDSGNASPLRQLAPSKVFSSLERLVQTATPVVSKSRDVEQHSHLLQASELIETNSTSRHSLIKAAIDYFFGRLPSLPGAESSLRRSDSSPFLGDRLNQLPLLHRFRFNRLSPNPSDPQISYLIRAAIDYFFGQSRQTLSGTTTSLPEAHQSGTLPWQPSFEDPWLSWEDLFEATPTSQPTQQPRELTPPQLPTTNPIRLGTPLAKLKRVLNQQRQSTLSTQSANSTAQSEASKVGAINSVQEPALERSPDWIDIHATPIGYIKHPLEKILAWLDRIILWLEELTANVWRWLSKRR